MNRQSRLWTLLKLIVGIGLSSQIVSCGGDSLSGDVKFNPEENPIAISSSVTIGDGDSEEVIKGPWYLFRYSIKNDSAQRLRLVTFKLTVTSSKIGSKPKVYTIDPGKDCRDGFSRPFIADLVAGAPLYSGLDVDNSGPVTDPLSRCDTTLVLTPPAFEGWYLADLPASDNLVYSVKIEGEGWFENASGEITERAYISGFQITR
jgi:hypothetical protein